MYWFYEFNYEGGCLQCWVIGMVDDQLFCVVGLWCVWEEFEGGYVFLFIQIIINVDVYFLMNCFYKLGEEKCNFVIILFVDYVDWFNVGDMENVCRMLVNYFVSVMKVWFVFKSEVWSSLGQGLLFF